MCWLVPQPASGTVRISFTWRWKLLLAVLLVCERNTLSSQGQLLRPSIAGAVRIPWEPGYDVLGDVDVRSLMLPSCWWLRLRSSFISLSWCYAISYASRSMLDYAILDLAHTWAAQYHWFLFRCSDLITACFTV